MNWTEEQLEEWRRRNKMPATLGTYIPPERRLAYAAPSAPPQPAKPKRQVQQHRAGQMNKTEAAFGAHLELLKKAGEIREYWFERWTWKLADGVRYTPDFVVLTDTGLVAYEVKGFMRDDARIKCRTFAQLFPLRLIVVRKEGPGWEYEEVRRID